MQVAEHYRYALRLAIGASLMVLLTNLTHMVDGYWITLTLIVCSMPSLGQTLLRAQQRLLGTFIGAVLAILLIEIFPNSITAMKFILPLTIFLAYYLKPFSYTLGSIFITVTAVLLINLLTPHNLSVSYLRLACTLLGAIAVIFIAFTLVPIKSQVALKNCFNEMMLNFAKTIRQSLDASINSDDHFATDLLRQQLLQQYTQNVNESVLELIFTKKKYILSWSLKLVRLMDEAMILLREYASQAKNCFLYLENEALLLEAINRIAANFINLSKNNFQQLTINDSSELQTILNEAISYRIQALLANKIPFASMPELIYYIYFLQQLKFISYTQNKLNKIRLSKD